MSSERAPRSPLSQTRFLREPRTPTASSSSASSRAHRDPALAPVADDLPRAVVAVDYDGTLAPIVDDPARATPDRGARDALGALVGRAAIVAVVSGRPVEFLSAQLELDGVVLIGQYGLEHLRADGVVVDERTEPYVGAVEQAAEELARAWPGFRIERKGRLAVTIHWRGRHDAPAPAELHALAARHGLATLDGRKACELRPPVPVDKGTALTELVQQAHAKAALFAGDETGDLAAFDALDRLAAAGRLEHAVRVAVRSDEAPPELLGRADVVLAGQAGVAAMLSSLLPP